MSTKSKQPHLALGQEAWKVDRRQFMVGSAAVTLSASMAGIFATNARAEPKKGGFLRAAVSEGSTSNSPDPATTGNQEGISLNHTFRNYLTEIAPDNSLAPELAESWEASGDAKNWRFKIRNGVEFHDGKTMTVQDVITSLNHHRGESTKSAAKVLLEPITDIKADGDYLVIELNAGNADFPFVLTDYHLTIGPDDTAGNLKWHKYEGTGPYVMENWDPGVSAKLKRNPNYWKEGRAHLDEVELLIIADNNARETALRTGDIHAMDQVALKTIHLFSRDSNVEIDDVPSWAHLSIPMNQDESPFGDKNVRLAVKHAVNRKEMVDTILRGYGSVGNDQPLAGAIQFAATDIDQREQDLDKAKFYLKEAGMTSLDIELSTAEAAGAGSIDAAVLFAEQAKGAGINIKVVREAEDGYWANVWLKKPFCMVNWGGRPTADVMFSTAYADGAAWNETHFKNERFNKLLVEARAELDVAKRTEMYREMQMLVRDESGALIPMFKNLVYARRPEVKHSGQLSANWALDGGRWAERWWLT